MATLKILNTSYSLVNQIIIISSQVCVKNMLKHKLEAIVTDGFSVFVLNEKLPCLKAK